MERAEGKYCQNCKHEKLNLVLAASFCEKKGRYLEGEEARQNYCDDWEAAQVVPVETTRARCRCGFSSFLSVSEWGNKQVGKT